MKRSWSLLVAVSLASAAAAQNVPPALMVKPKGKPEPLRITRAVVEARIFGYLAETKMTLTFHNPHDQALAGELYFPLPEGATVSGYALDIRDRMVDAVIVEKHRGRQVFEKELRKGIDPGLVEWVKGNSFRTRVFPIPARGSRRVRVEYVSELPPGENGTTWRLPLKFKDKVGEFSLRVEVVKAAAAPKVAANGPPGFQFARWRDSFVAETTLKDAALNEDLVIALPGVEKQRVLVERAPDGQVYFCINDFPAPPAAQPAPAPQRVAILWDASGSRGRTRHKRELELLKAFFKDRSLTADLVVFRSAAEPVRHFQIKDGDAGKLLSELQKVPYDGGTQMGCISPPPDHAQPSFYLLFTDGMSNFGTEEPTGLKSPLHILSADSAADYGRAMKLLTKVVMNRWDRFEEIELIALMELNRLIPKARAAGVKELPLDERLTKLLDVDVRIVLTWDADLTDMDLHVVEPSGERAYYQHNRTTIGGLLSCDFTEGYGPEEYVLRKAMPGTYRIQVNYYGRDTPALIGPVTVQAEVFTNYGRADEKRKSLTLRLKQQEETLTIGDIEF